MYFQSEVLDHEDESTSIRVAARQRCLTDHTWERRFSALLKMVNLLSDHAASQILKGTFAGATRAVLANRDLRDESG